MEPLVTVVSRRLEQDLSGDRPVIYIVDTLACGHDIWIDPSVSRLRIPAYQPSTRRRCQECAGRGPKLIRAVPTQP